MKVSAAIRDSAKILSSHQSVLQEIYGSYISEQPEVGFDITLNVPLTSLPETDEDKEKLAKSLAQIKRNVVSAPLIARSRALANKAPMTEPFQWQHRLGESIYFIPRPDRVIVTFDMAFKDPTDLELARVFLQEFNEAKRVSHLASAPQPTFLPPSTPPQEIKDSGFQDSSRENPNRVGYITFALLDRHVTPQALDNTVDRIIQFRAYLHYHIKCSKSHMHSRMRKRVESLLQVLNRAVPDVPKEKKTYSGRSFKVSTGGTVGL